MIKQFQSQNYLGYLIVVQKLMVVIIGKLRITTWKLPDRYQVANLSKRAQYSFVKR